MTVSLPGLICLMCFFCAVLSAEEVKIARVLDANLFELKDGRKIRLANLEAPSTHDPDPYRAALAKMIKKYGQEQLAGQTLLAEFIAEKDSACDCFPAHLFRKFTLKTLWYNQSYLKEGYGAYAASPDSTYHREYFAASETARKSKRGIWDPARYKPRPNRHSVNLLAGAGDRPGFSDNYYREIHVSYEPIQYKNGFSIAFGLIQTEAVDYRDAQWKIATFYLPYLVPQYRVQGDYIGFNTGFFFNLKVFTRGEDDPPHPPLFFNLGLKVGVLRACYLSADLLSDFLLGPLAIGINFKISNPYLYLWVGKVYFESEQNGFGFKLDALITKRYILRAQYISNFEAQDKQYGFRVGLGYVLGTR